MGWATDGWARWTRASCELALVQHIYYVLESITIYLFSWYWNGQRMDEPTGPGQIRLLPLLPRPPWQGPVSAVGWNRWAAWHSFFEGCGPWLLITLFGSILRSSLQSLKKIVLTDGQILSTIAQQKWLEAWQGDFIIFFFLSFPLTLLRHGKVIISYLSFPLHFVVIFIYSFEAGQGDYIRVILFFFFSISNVFVILIILLLSFRQWSTIEFYPYCFELQQPLWHIKGFTFFFFRRPRLISLKT